MYLALSLLTNTTSEFGELEKADALRHGHGLKPI